MDCKIALGLLSTILSITAVASMNITVCDCSQPKTIGLLDAELPSYCQETVAENPVIKKYQFFIKEEPHAHWDGFVCRTWVKTKKIEGFFFGGYDTTFTTSVRPMAEKECWEMVQYHRCFENGMEGAKDSFAFTASPVGPGAWMQTKEYGIINCLLQRITLRKDCVKCPITSPYGILTNNSETSFVRHRDSIIVWDASKANISDQCNLKELKNGTGLVTKVDTSSLKLVDNTAQLEFFYYENLENICKRPLRKLKNLDAAYLHITAQNWSHIYNEETKVCLDINMETAPCNGRKPHEFLLLDNEIAINNEELGAVHANCIAPAALYALSTILATVIPKRKGTNPIEKPRPTNFHVKSSRCGQKINFRWNSETLEITSIVDGREGCLTARGGLQPSLADCNQEKNQKWIFGLPNIPIKRKMDDGQPLLLQHHQYMEHQATVNENVLEKEIKKIYCGNLQVRRYTLMLLAEQNGLLAARANKLPACQRLKIYGDYFLVQQCKLENISVGMKETKCGPEPIFQNYTIGKDGFSLHPFEECFWANNFVNLNGKLYLWKDGDWSAIQPTAHLSTLKLVSKFTELEDNEAQYLLNSHDIFERPEYEQINAVNEIVNKIHESNTRSLSAILVNEREESRFWSFTSWAAKMRASLITVILVVILTICVIFLLWKYKSRIGGLQEILTHFAIGVQERRRRQNNVLTE